MDLISIIAPAYNQEKWLERCVHSVMSQTYRYFELLLIDDGSWDNTATICQSLAKTDDRIKVFHKKNGGLSDARNFGMKLAQGEFILFLDTDDYLSPSTLETLYGIAKKADADIVQCGHIRTDTSDCKTTMLNPEYSVLSISEAHWGLTGRKYRVYPMAWGKLYRKQVLDHIEFPVGKIHEDEAVIHHILFHSNRFALTKEILWYYFTNENSVMHSPFSEKKFDIITALKDRIQCYRQHECKELAEAVSIRCSVEIIRLYRKLIANNGSQSARNYLLSEYKALFELFQDSSLLLPKTKEIHQMWCLDPTQGDIYDVWSYFDLLPSVKQLNAANTN